MKDERKAAIQLFDILYSKYYECYMRTGQRHFGMRRILVEIKQKFDISYEETFISKMSIR